MNYRAHDKQFYADLYYDIKYNGYHNMPKLSHQEKMEYAYYNMQLAAGNDFPLNCIIMRKDWFEEWCKQQGEVKLDFNELKIYFEPDMLVMFAFMYQEK